MAKKISIELIKRIEAELAALPPCPAREVTKTEAIRKLAPLIAGMQSKGYSHEAIAAMLSERGVSVSAIVLKTYLKRAKSRTKGTKPAASAIRQANGPGDKRSGAEEQNRDV